MVKQGEPERQFYFGAVVHGDYLELALLLPELEDRLNERIDLRTFTDRLEHIYFAPLLVPSVDTDQPEERHYDEEHKELLLMLPIAVDGLSDAPEATFATAIGNLLGEELIRLELGDETLQAEIQQILAPTDDSDSSSVPPETSGQS